MKLPWEKEQGVWQAMKGRHCGVPGLMKVCGKGKGMGARASLAMAGLDGAGACVAWQAGASTDAGPNAPKAERGKRPTHKRHRYQLAA